MTALQESDIEEETAIPQEIAPEPSSRPVTPRGRSTTAPPPLPDRRPATRDDTGLRMIGSLGRDRAEASGELGPRPSQPAFSDTQRELVTILPRRITREFEKLPADTVITSAGPPKPPPRRPKPASAPPSVSAADAAPVGRPPANPVEPPEVATSMNRMFEGSGVYRQRGPGAGPIALFVVAALLVGVAVFAWLRRDEDADTPARSVDDRAAVTAAHDAGVVTVEVSDAALASMTPPIVDAAVAVAPIDARRAPSRDAAVAPADPNAERAAQAKDFMQRANNALQEGNFPTALEYADASLKLRKTARTYLLRAQALQRLERVDDALAALDAAAELSPTYAPIFDWRGRILWAANRKDEARFAFQQFLELEPSSARARAVRDLLGEARPTPAPPAPAPAPADTTAPAPAPAPTDTTAPAPAPAPPATDPPAPSAAPESETP